MPSPRITLVDSIAALALLAVGLTLVMPSLIHARAVSRQATCSDHFKVIGIALRNYDSTYLTFPPGRIWEPDPTRPPHDNGASVLFLPFMDQEALYNAFNFWHSWIAPTNKTVRDAKIELFLCPDDQSVPLTVRVEPSGQPTNVMFSLGSLAWLTHPTHPDANRGPNPEGVFFDNSQIGLREMPDGSSFTVLASEQLVDRTRSEGSPDVTGECSGAATAGKQFYERTGTRWVTGHPSSNYFNARRTPNHPEPDCFQGISPVGIGSLNKLPRSQHEAGVNVLLGDGAVRFIRNGIDLKVWQALNTRAGGEIINANDL